MEIVSIVGASYSLEKKSGKMEELQTSEIKNGHAQGVVYRINRLKV